MSYFSDRLKALRESRNRTQAEVAEDIGMNRNTYGGYESGSREPSLDNIIRICHYFGVKADALIPTEPDPDIQYIEIRTRDIGRELTPQEREVIETYARFITRGKNL